MSLAANIVLGLIVAYVVVLLVSIITAHVERPGPPRRPRQPEGEIK